jgi:GAF domain-containing protein
MPDELANSYVGTDLDCCLLIPVIRDDKVVGIIEAVDKINDPPLFDVEDEYIMQQLATMCSIVMSHNQMRAESKIRGENIQAVLKTASLMSSAMEISGMSTIRCLDVLTIARL